MVFIIFINWLAVTESGISLNAFWCLVRKPGFKESGSGGEKSYAAFSFCLKNLLYPGGIDDERHCANVETVQSDETRLRLG